MLEPDFDIKYERPILLKIEDGLLICRNIVEGQSMLFYSVSGRLNKIYAAERIFRNGSFMYWHIELLDNENGNVYVICFPYTSALFQSVILKLLLAESFSDIKIEPYPGNTTLYCRTRHSKVRVYADGIELRTLAVKLPKIVCHKYGSRIHKDYSQRISSVGILVSSIMVRLRNFNTRVQAGGIEKLLKNY